MSAPHGHGYRELAIVTPLCKCGWRGKATTEHGEASRQYEAHKAGIRRAQGSEHPSLRAVP